jgi:hypothetical protein
VPNQEFVLGSGFNIHLFWHAENFILHQCWALLFIMLLILLILADHFILACFTSIPPTGSSMLTQHSQTNSQTLCKLFRQKIILQNKRPPNENDQPLYPTTNCKIRSQIPECRTKKRNRDRNAKSCATPALAPKKSGVIQLQCTNFPKKDSEGTEDSEYSDNSDNTDDSNDSNNSFDNIGSNLDSCIYDEERDCDYYITRWLISN